MIEAQQKMVRISPGEFMMGTSAESVDIAMEKPAHPVRISHSFEIAVVPVSQAMYHQITGENPSSYQQPDAPVTNVRWLDAALFCNVLSRRDGFQPVYHVSVRSVTLNWLADGYRLPTEAEWEYVAKAGDEFLFSGSNESAAVAWFGEPRSEGYCHPSGQKAPNSWGMFDMCGNVQEWCNDAYIPDLGYAERSQEQPTIDPVQDIAAASMRMLRGGSFCSNEQGIRISARSFATVNTRCITIGFRILRTVKKTT